jgi:hypothetical protein
MQIFLEYRIEFRPGFCYFWGASRAALAAPTEAIPPTVVENAPIGKTKGIQWLTSRTTVQASNSDQENPWAMGTVELCPDLGAGF